MLQFIDAGCKLGMPAVPGAQPWQTEQILELMDRCRIEKAIAYHEVAIQGEVQPGNLLMAEEAAKNDRFLPQWCVLPHAFGEFMDAAALNSAMKANGVTSLRIAPQTFHHTMERHCMGELMDMAAQCHVPVFFSYAQAQGDGMYDLCTTYPEVNFVVTETAYALNRWLGPVLDSCDNLYVGTGNYVVHRGLKTFADYYGAEKLIFTTGLPAGSATAAVSLIALSELSNEQKALVSRGNIERLLSRVQL